MSKGFIELILKMFPQGQRTKAHEFAFDFLFDFAHSLGKSDYGHCVAKLALTGRVKLHPLKRLIGLKKAFANLGWGSIKFDFRTANLVYTPDHFFRFTLDNSFEAYTWLRAKQKLKEEEEARRDVEEAAAELVKEKGISLEEAFRKLEKANKGTATRKTRESLDKGKENGTSEDEMTLLTNDIVKSPACVMAAGYANGFVKKCFRNKAMKEKDLDLVVVEVACRVTGSPSCEFITCSKNMVYSTVKAYLKEKNQLTFLPNIKYYNVMRKKDGKKK